MMMMMMLRARHGGKRPTLAWALSIMMLGFGLAFSLPAKAQDTFEATRFSMEVSGEGPDVIFIPGLSTSREVWRAPTANLEGYRVHLLQVRGFGDDAAGVNAEGEVLDPLVEEVAQYIRANGLDRPAIVGHSMGGFTAMRLAAEHPRLAGKILIVDSLPWFAAIMVAPGSEPDMDTITMQAEGMRSMVLSTFGRDMPDSANDRVLLSYLWNDEHLPLLREWTASADPRVTGQLLYEIMTQDMREGIAAITVPVTVIYPHQPGFMDPDAIQAFYRQQFAALPEAQFVGIGEAAHFVMVDQPEAFGQALAEFLAD